MCYQLHHPGAEEKRIGTLDFFPVSTNDITCRSKAQFVRGTSQFAACLLQCRSVLQLFAITLGAQSTHESNIVWQAVG